MGSSPPASAQRPATPRRIIPHRPKLWQRLAALVVYGLARVMALTIRFRWQDHSGIAQGNPGERAIFCIWHNRLALSLILFERYFKHQRSQRHLAAMVSASRDGALLVGILELFKVQPVRGSSSRRGPQALMEMTTWAERGCDLAITPDGPKGPAYQVQEGVIALAQLTQLPIIPAVYHLNWKFRLQTWDRFLVPLPFATCEVQLGSPMRIAREASEAERASLRLELEKQMLAMTRE